MTVSYTHLDVYKRQDMWIYELASILCKLPSEEFAASFSCRILKEVKGCGFLYE